MTKENKQRLMVGVFVVLGFVLLMVAVGFIGEKSRLFSKTIKLHTVFKDIGGLQSGGNVRFAGINVGTIDNVTIISDTAVRVEFIIDKNVKKFIKKGATAGINSDGLMGDKLLVITSGNADQPEVKDGEELPAGGGSNMDVIMAQAAITMNNAAAITTDLSAIVGGIKEGKGTIGKILMDDKFAKNIDGVVVNAKTGLKGFSENMEAAKSNFLFKGYYKKKEKELEKEKQAKLDSLEDLKKKKK
jgi:phospholipid/cholesterol/gamma-HCH transport system substrate-binding protein